MLNITAAAEKILISGPGVNSMCSVSTDVKSDISCILVNPNAILLASTVLVLLAREKSS